MSDSIYLADVIIDVRRVLEGGVRELTHVSQRKARRQGMYLPAIARSKASQSALSVSILSASCGTIIAYRSIPNMSTPG